jgi:predicted ATPase/DNA-binding XRE family transcriptional regulator
VTGRQPRFGDLLRHYRTAAGLTQEELAERAGISRRAISDLERGARTRPWRETVAMIAGALDLNPDERRALEQAVARTRTPAAPAAEPAGLAALDLTPLFGREREEAAINHLLDRDDSRVLTLTGTGGVGKTRLAVRIALSREADYAGGVYLVPLAPVQHPDHVASAIAGVVGLQEVRGRTLRETLQRFFTRRHSLLVLDNLEHLLDAAPFLTELLVSCPQLTLLVTSRERLHVRGEQEFPLLPLETPPSTADRVSAGDLARYPASALFLARARAVTAGVHISESEATAIAEICRRLDGLPLALELAAVQIKYESPQELLARLEHRFDVLVGGPREGAARQRTMRDCIAWSVDLLTAGEREMLCRLAVFVAGCTRDAAEAVIGSGRMPPNQVLAAIPGLVDKSLLVAERSAGGTRYLMLETIRQYALERLHLQGQSQEAYAAYARYYAGLAEEAARLAWGPGEPAILERLAGERDNLRAVLKWTLDHDVELGLRMAGALVRFWNVDGRYGDWRTWIEQALGAGRQARASVRARALIAAGWVALQEGDLTAAIGRFGEALNLARGNNEPGLVLHALPGFGLAELSQGAIEVGKARFREGLDLCQALGATHLRGALIYGLGLAAQVEGDLRRAREHLEEAVGLFRGQGESVSIGSAQRALGTVALAQGSFLAALASFQDGLQTALRTQHRDGVAIALEGIAASLAALGRLEPAARIWGAAEAIHETVHDPRGEGEVPFARIAQFSPHLDAIATHVTESSWRAAEAEGRAAPLEETLAILERLDPA